MSPATSITATILGCGSSGGVPRVGNLWGACDPLDPRNRRRRCSLLLTGTRTDTAGTTRILIDTGCDMREQLLDADVDDLDAVFYTHEHADHTHGIDDLRAIALNQKKRIDVYFAPTAAKTITRAFSYCFQSPPGSGYPPILTGHVIHAGEPVTISGAGGTMTLLPVLQEHGNITSLGYRIGDLLYSCDVSAFPTQSEPALEDLSVWIIDALRHKPHPSHLCLAQTLELVERFKPRRAILTNMHLDLDYEKTSAILPHNVEMAHDGLQISLAL